MEVSEVRKKLLQVIDRAKRTTAERRERVDAAVRAYERWLHETAQPIFQMFATVLRAEKYSFRVDTPQDGVRLTSERSAEDYIELELDTSGEAPVVIGRVSRSRGGRVIKVERSLREGVAIDQLTDRDVLDFLLEEIEPFVNR